MTRETADEIYRIAVLYDNGHLSRLRIYYRLIDFRKWDARYDREAIRRECQKRLGITPHPAILT